MGCACRSKGNGELESRPSGRFVRRRVVGGELFVVGWTNTEVACASGSSALWG